MKHLILTAAFAVLFAAPSFAEDAEIPAATGGEAVAVEATTEASAPVAEVAATTEAAATVDVAAATEACTTETNEKVKLPENAGEAEKAQWDAALAECLKGKGVEEAPAADAAAAAPAAEEAAPAAEAEAAADAAAETPAAE